MTDVLDLAASLRAQGTAFCLATVVRTVAATAAKAGAKAVIGPDGTLTGGWIGGGCARAAVLRAAAEALADGAPRLVSITPEALLAERGLAPGDTRDGVRFARNLCPSQGTMDIFVEPVLPRPALVVIGASPVALALTRLAPQFGYDLAPSDAPATAARRHVVVATQGRGDADALRAALALDAAYTAFVGSRAKMAALRAQVPGAEHVVCPAGLDLGAITPDEIALSILAQILALRRQGQRG